MPAFAGTISQTYLFDKALGNAKAKALSAGSIVTTGSTFACSDDGQGNLTISGGIAGDDLYGTNQMDSLFGQRGSDWIEGGRGADALNGGAGDDRLLGGRGADDLIGGRGFDVFQFAGAADSAPGHNRDVVHDFQSGIDRIDLSAMSGLSFIGATEFSSVAGEVRFNSSQGLVEIDLDGNGVADSTIQLPLVSAMTESDFILT